MSEQTQSSRIRDLLFRSPYFLLIFLLVPAITLICNQLRIAYPVNLLLISNVCFLLTLFIRFLWCLLRMRAPIRYGDARRPSRDATVSGQGADQLRSALEGSGYRFVQSGRYGEKSDLGFPGLILLYGGLLTALLLGTYDHLAQFTAAVRATASVPQALNDPKKYRNQIVGPLAGYKNMPHLLVKRQISPGAEWPKGAAEIALYSEDSEELASGIIAAGKPLRYGGLEIDLTRFSYDAVVSILTTTNHPQYRNYVALIPQRDPGGSFTYHGTLEQNLAPQFAGITGEAWFNPKENLLRITAIRDGKAMIDTELQLRGTDRKVQGEYIAFFEGLSSWTEMRVFRTRHLSIIAICAAIALLGGIMRLVFRPQRVWLEDMEGGSRVWVKGRLKVEG